MPSEVRLGLALILAACAWIGGRNWLAVWRLANGNWVPLEMPLPLTDGHFRTPEFEVNVAGRYELDVVCPSGPNSECSVPHSWILRNGARVLARGEHTYTSFTLVPGRYTLEYDIRNPPLDDPNPTRLRIHESGGKREALWDSVERSLWTSLVSIAIGACIILRGVISWRIEKRCAWLSAYPLTTPGPQPPVLGTVHFGTQPTRRRLWPGLSVSTMYSRMSRVSLILFISLFFILTAEWVMYSLNENGHYRALNVHLQAPHSVSQTGPGIAPLLVFVGRDHRIYLDSQPIAWEDLGAALRKGSALRPPSWPIYVEGDRELEFQWVARVIDIARGVPLEVTLVSR